MGVNNSPNMNLPVPQVGNESGPQYAQDINNCLTIVDQHDHGPGSGVQITPAGLDINTDLPINDNNLTFIKSARFAAQGSPLAGVSDLDCLYVSGIDLYYNDGNGTQVRITQSGGIAGTPGSISNLVPPASASYVSGTSTFVFQSGATTPGNIDGASFVLRNLTSMSKGLTLSPPNAMAADFSITLPALPLVTNILQMDSAGNITAALNVDNTSLAIVSNQIGLKANSHAVTQSMLALRSGPSPSVGVGGVALSAAVSGSTGTINVPVDITSVTITTAGRPVFVTCISNSTSSDSLFNSAASNDICKITLFRDGVAVSADYNFYTGGGGMIIPPSSISFMDFPSAGTYVYKISAKVNTTSGCSWTNVQLLAYEI